MNVTIDDQPITVADWEASCETDEGDRTFTAKLPDIGRAEQGAPLVAWRRSDDALWSGTLDLDPWKNGDLWEIRASGQAQKMTDETRMFYRTDGGSQWVDQNGDPHGFQSHQMFEFKEKGGGLFWRFGDGSTSAASGDNAGAALWMEGGLITRYSLIAEPNQTLTAFDLVVRKSTGPGGTGLATVATHSLNIGSPTSYATTISSPTDQILIRVTANGATTPTGARRVKVTSLKAYGRTTDDDFALSDVVADVAALYGFATDGITGNAGRALPLDWTEDHPSLLDYMAELADWRWLVKHDGVHFGPYAKTWDAFPDDGGRSLQPESRANRVVVPYRTVGGQLRTAEATPDEDPYPGRDFPISTDELEDPQSSDDVATAYAQAVANYEASAQLTGTLDLSRVRYRSEERTPWDVEPGMLLNMPDLVGFGPQRIRAVTYKPDGGTVEIGTPFNAVRALADAERARPRKRKRKRRHSRRSKKRADMAAP